MTSPAPLPSLFLDADGYLRSPEDAAMYALTQGNGQGYTTPAREARRMLASSNPRYKAMAQAWLAERNLARDGEEEPPGWQNWHRDWLREHPGEPALTAIAQMFPGNQPAGRNQAADEVIAPPAVLVKVPPGSRLESLLAQQATIKARVEEAKAQLKSITTAAAQEIVGDNPQKTRKFIIPASEDGLWPEQRLYWAAPVRCDTKALKAALPDVYKRFLARIGGSWVLAIVKDKGKK
jgi:hypothetical protein